MTVYVPAPAEMNGLPAANLPFGPFNVYFPSEAIVDSDDAELEDGEESDVDDDEDVPT